MRKNESAYSREFIKILNDSGSFYVWKNHGSQFGSMGISDIIGIDKFSGKFIAIEVKLIRTVYTSYEQLHSLCTALQLNFLSKIQENKGCAILVGMHQLDKKIVVSAKYNVHDMFHTLLYKDRATLPNIFYDFMRGM